MSYKFGIDLGCSKALENQVKGIFMLPVAFATYKKNGCNWCQVESKPVMTEVQGVLWLTFYYILGYLVFMLTLWIKGVIRD